MKRCGEAFQLKYEALRGGLNQWSSMWAKSSPSGRFHSLWGDFVIYEIWGAISVSRGAISAG